MGCNLGKNRTEPQSKGVFILLILRELRVSVRNHLPNFPFSFQHYFYLYMLISIAKYEKNNPHPFAIQHFCCVFFPISFPF